MATPINSTLLGIKFRVFAIIIVTAIISFIFTLSLVRSRSTHMLPTLEPITAQKLNKLGAFSAQVNTGLHVRNFSTFDTIKKLFVMDAIVWFEFNPADISLERIEKFTFARGNILRKSTPDIKKVGKNILALYEVTVSFQDDFDFHAFPFEAHQIAILLTNTYVTPYEMIYKTTDSSFHISPRFSLANWKITKLHTEYGYSTAVLDPKYKERETTSPEALFIIDVFSLGVKNSLVIFIPLLFALLISLFSLLVPYKWEHYNRYMRSLASAGLTSLLAYRFVIQSMLPSVGYATTTDKAYTLCLFVAFIPFLIQISSFIILKHNIDLTAEEGTVLAEKLSLLNVYAFLALATLSLASLAIILIT